MPRTPNAVPVYRLHSPTRQAVCTVRLPGGGRYDLYLGKHNTPASRAEFGRVVALVAANGGLYPAAAPDLSVNELLFAYLKYAAGYYRTTDGRPSPTVDRLKQTLKGLKAMYGPTPAAEFGPKALKALVASRVGEGLSRKTVNGRIGNVKRLFRWAVGEELVGPDVHARLVTVEGLRAGRTEAPDRPPVRPAVLADVEAALAHMPPPVRALVVVQLHSGARAGELVKLRGCDIDRTDPVAWVYRPAAHKGTWKGRGRVIYFGGRCREALAPLLAAAPSADAYLFSPDRGEADRNAARSEARVTPRYQSHMARNRAKRKGAARRRPRGICALMGSCRLARAYRPCGPAARVAP
ncbi:MAG: hypothetical protein C0501_19780 [Isosphaera sp.]|nr:hypothetical protein [Isosphaera sp.]